MVRTVLSRFGAPFSGCATHPARQRVKSEGLRLQKDIARATITATRSQGGCSTKHSRARAARRCGRVRPVAGCETGPARYPRVSATGYSVRPGCFVGASPAPQQEEVQEHVQDRMTMPALPAAALVVAQAKHRMDFGPCTRYFGLPAWWADCCASYWQAGLAA